MTSKFEHSIINQLTKKKNTLIIHHCYQNPEINLPSMERILKSQKIESMKKMMLMQEQVFKQQVEEMHRLYNLQKKLMQETEKNGQKQVNLKQNNLQESSSRNDPITNEVSGSNSAENTPPIHSTIHPFEEAKNTAADDVVVEGADVEVELTLSIGRHCTRKKQRSKSSDQIRKLKESDDRMKEETQEINASNSSSSSVYQENRRPHWLMQDLSLNRT